MNAAERALFAERMREAEAEHVAYADEGGTPPYKHARDVALACRLAAMVAEPSAESMTAMERKAGMSDGLIRDVLDALLIGVGAADEEESTPEEEAAQMNAYWAGLIERAKARCSHCGRAAEEAQT